MPLLGTFGEGSARAYGLYGSRPQIGLTISSNTYNYDVYTNRGPSYVAGASDIVVTVNPGVTVGSTSTGTYALLVPSAFSPTDKITIVNNGVIQGMGGAGGNGGAGGAAPANPGGAGAVGGNAIYVNRPTTITNNGTVASGGGGGGGNGGYTAGGAKSPSPRGGGGGGGGAGFNGGAGGTGGPGVAASGSPGGAGTSPAGGGGGASGTPSVQYPGGAGGGRGAAGSASLGPVPAPLTFFVVGGPGGAAGNYIVGNPFVTWPVTGTRQGNVA